jgi:hypothetical protein
LSSFGSRALSRLSCCWLHATWLRASWSLSGYASAGRLLLLVFLLLVFLLLLLLLLLKLGFSIVIVFVVVFVVGCRLCGRLSERDLFSYPILFLASRSNYNSLSAFSSGTCLQVRRFGDEVGRHDVW